MLLCAVSVIVGEGTKEVAKEKAIYNIIMIIGRQKKKKDRQK